MSEFDDKLRELNDSKDEDSETNPGSLSYDDNNDDQMVEDKDEQETAQQKKSQQDELMEIAIGKIETLFKDQYSEGFAKIFVKDHYEIILVTSGRFKRFLSKIYYENKGKIISSESTNNVANLLQAKTEFGDIQYTLSLRVAEYDGNLYYDLTNEKHQSIKISKNGTWELIDQTPIPLFKRYNQTPQALPFMDFISEDDEDSLEVFFSMLTNIKNKEDRIIIKVGLVTWFIPNIPHIILIAHGGKGSAKSTFLTMIKSIVDPAKPSLFTIHDDKSEFIQQIAHNYMSVYDNLKYNPKWLSDEVCKAITGVGQTKRMVYTVDEDKIFEYKHCLLFNGINAAFSEPDVIDRSISIELSEILPENRRTEKEILQEFEKLKPKILKYIFDVLAKAIEIKNDINLKNLPRMADSAIWGESIARVMGYKENEFLNAYYNNIKFQNAEVIDSNPVAFAIKKLVENILLDKDDNSSQPGQPIFIGTPAELLKRLEDITYENKISTYSKEWPKDQKWLVRRINLVKSNLQQELGIEIKIERDLKNTSIIKIEKNDSGNSGEHKITPENESLSPYFDGLSPDSDKLSPDNIDDLSTNSNRTGDSGDSGDKSVYVMEDTNKEEDNRSDDISKKCNFQVSTDPRIGHNHPFYYCIEHPKVQNINLESITHHLLYSTEHTKENENK